jgi:HD-like signal output (HDOD) protein
MAIASKKCGNCNRSFTSDQDFLHGTSRWRVCSDSNLWFNCACGSTLILPKNKYDWYSPEIAMGPEAKAIFNQLSETKNLPHIPASILKLQTLIQDPSSEFDDMAKAIKTEPFIAAQILAMANHLKSSREQTNQSIKSIEHGILYIGKKALNDLVMAVPAQILKVNTAHFDLEKFWINCFLHAAIAEKISARYSAKFSPEEVYLAAFLSNLGKVVCGFYYPEMLDRICQLVSSPKTMMPWPKAEKKLGTPSHVVMGEVAAAIWGLPEFVMDGIRFHHHPAHQPKSDPATVKIYEVVGFSSLIKHWILLEPGHIDKMILKSYMNYFDLTEKALESLVSEMTVLKNAKSPLAS